MHQLLSLLCAQRLALAGILFFAAPTLLHGQSDVKEFSFQTDASSGNGSEGDITGYSLLGITIVGSTGADRVVSWEVADNIGTFSSLQCTNVDTLTQSAVATANSTTPVRFQCPVAGFRKFRARISGGTTGTIRVSGLGLTKTSRSYTSGVGGGSGDVDSIESTSVDSQVMLYSGTSGVQAKKATSTGIPKLTGGVLDIAVPGTDYQAPLGFVAVPETRTFTISGTANEITCVGGTQSFAANRTWTCSFAPIVDFNGQIFLLTRGTSVPGICTIGELFFNTSAVDGENLNLCVSPDTWVPISGSGSGVSFANPSASIGLTAINGVASTAMRSDSAPALSQAITPTWTALHTFAAGITGTANVTEVKNGAAAQTFRVYGDATDYVILRHDGTNPILDSNSGALKLGSTAVSPPVSGSVPLCMSPTGVVSAGLCDQRINATSTTYTWNVDPGQCGFFTISGSEIICAGGISALPAFSQATSILSVLTAFGGF